MAKHQKLTTETLTGISETCRQRCYILINKVKKSYPTPKQREEMVHTMKYSLLSREKGELVKFVQKHMSKLWMEAHDYIDLSLLTLK